MKKAIHLFISLTILLVFFSCSQNNSLVLVDMNQTEYDILISSNADSLTLEAAEMLSEYIIQASGTKLEINTDSSLYSKHIVIGYELIREKNIRAGFDALSEEGFVIMKANDNILLYGKTTLGNRNAVYTFLEEYIGYIKFNAEEEFVPSTERIELNIRNKVYNPAFAFRMPHFQGRYDKGFRDWHKISNFDNWGMFVHTFKKLINPDDYFEDHPEYFALMNGKRIPDSQLCLSNLEAIQELKDNLRKMMLEEPEKVYWSVSQNDYINYCECDDCNAKYEEYGSVSGIYIEMANALAEEFPDKQISTLAYQFTRSAPKNIKPADNVNIMFCSIECNRSMPLEDDHRSASFINDLKDWAAISNNLFMWDYVVQFKNYLCPFPNFHVLQPNIKLFQKHGVKMMFQQGSGRNWSDQSDVKQYLIAKLLWNPDLDADSIVMHYINHYYGDAAPYMLSYHRMAEEAMIANQEENNLNIYGFPMSYRSSFLSTDLLLRYKELMDSAELAVGNDSPYLKRVLKQRLAIDYAYIDVAINVNDEKLHFIRTSIEGEKHINQDMFELLDKMVLNAKLTNTPNVNERNFILEEYQSYITRKVELMALENALVDAEIISKTPFSEKYPVGGEAALVDGITGGLNFSFNWLGYEGEDMILDIKLKDAKEISSVKMNFLRDNLSWVFLPTDVIIEVSDNGKDYHQVAIYHSDTIENFVLETSIPFDFEFDKVKASTMRITAKSIKKCPKWHRGWGGDSWIFIDEIVVQ